MGRVWQWGAGGLMALSLWACNLYDSTGGESCPCPSGYQCCEGRGYCVPTGSSCDVPPDRRTPPLPPPEGLPDGAVPPAPSPGTPLSTATCCEGECSPVVCDGWDFAAVNFATQSEVREALAGNWQGFRHVIWETDDKAVELSFGDDTYVSDCLPAWCQSALYWGVDGRNESLDYQLLEVSPGLPVEARLTVYMGGQMVGAALYDRGTARFELDASRTRMRIWFTRDWGDTAPEAPATLYLQKIPE